MGKKSLFFLFGSNSCHQFLFDTISLFAVGGSGDCSEVGAVIGPALGEWDDMVHFSRVAFFQSQKSARLVGHAASFPLLGLAMKISVFLFIVSFCHISLTLSLSYTYTYTYTEGGLEEDLEGGVEMTPPENTGGVQPQEDD
mgnify:CR=1 FL=1